MDIQAPSEGGVNIEYFESSESMEGFEQVRNWLNYYCKKVSIVKT